MERLGRRRCLVCDTEQELFVPCFAGEIGPFCSSCGAPIERVGSALHQAGSRRRMKGTLPGATPRRQTS